MRDYCQVCRLHASAVLQVQGVEGGDLFEEQLEKKVGDGRRREKERDGRNLGGKRFESRSWRFAHSSILSLFLRSGLAVGDNRFEGLDGTLVLVINKED